MAGADPGFHQPNASDGCDAVGDPPLPAITELAHSRSTPGCLVSRSVTQQCRGKRACSPRAGLEAARTRSPSGSPARCLDMPPATRTSYMCSNSSLARPESVGSAPFAAPPLPVLRPTAPQRAAHAAANVVVNGSATRPRAVELKGFSNCRSSTNPVRRLDDRCRDVHNGGWVVPRPSTPLSTGIRTTFWCFSRERGNI